MKDDICDHTSGLQPMPCMLAIGGLDPSGGAGLPADIRAAAAFGVHACCVATAVVVQNTQGVHSVEVVSRAILNAQLDNILEDVPMRAVKIGVVPFIASIEAVAARLAKLNGIPVVLDTVFAPSNGLTFSDDDTVQRFVDLLLPQCDLVTPNMGECERLTGVRVCDLKSAELAARHLSSRGARSILIKGGHVNPHSRKAVDWLWHAGKISALTSDRIRGYEVRGTGCLLASAIAAQLASGSDIGQAVPLAKVWLNHMYAGAIAIGSGRRVALGLNLSRGES